MVVSVQSQIYLVAGILGGVSAILVVIVGVLFVVIDQLKNRLERVERAERTAVSTSRSATVTAASPRVIANVTGGHDNYAFTEPGIRPDEELARRGYVMSADQILAPRLQSIGGGMYGVVSREPYTSSGDFRYDSMGGTKDASGDFIVSPTATVPNRSDGSSSNIVQRGAPQNHLRNVSARPASNASHVIAAENYELPSPPLNATSNQRQKSQFNNNIMLATPNNHHLNSHMASTEFPSIDYEDDISSKHHPNDERVRNMHHY